MSADRIDLASEAKFRVGAALVDPLAHEATFNGFKERLQPQNVKVLIALARKRERVVTRDELIESCWDGRIVGDDVIHRAISTIRQFAARAGGFEIETVPRSGYRLTETGRRRLWPWAAGAALMLLLVGGLIAFEQNRVGAAARPETGPTITEEREALRTLDLTAVERLLHQGWNPNASIDENGDTALDFLLNDCEWDRGHDQHAMLLIARTLVEAGAHVDVRNNFGDTPYSIAKANRYCGPRHPVTRLFRMMCAQGRRPLGDNCLASYELERGAHFNAQRQ